MESCTKYQKAFESLQEATGMGWWFADRNSRTVNLSSFLANKLRLETDKLTFDAFKTHLHAESRDSVVFRLRELFTQKENNELDFLFSTPDGFQPVRIKITEREFVNGEMVTAEGFMQCLDTSEILTTPANSNVELIHLLRWQKSFTQSLNNLLDSSTVNDMVLDEIFKLILQNYKADAIRIFSVDYDTHILDCIHETTVKEGTSLKDHLHNMKINNEFLLANVLGKVPMYRDDVSDAFYRECGITYKSAKAFMAVPLMSKNGLWGFMKLDVYDAPRKWSYFDKESFQSIGNIIGVCMALRQSENMALSNSDFLYKFFQNMPIGYFSLRIEMNEEENVIDYEYLDVNAMFTEMVGLNRDQIMGKMHTEIGPIFVDKLDLQVLKRVAFEGEVFNTQGQMRHNKRYYNTTIYCPRHGDIVALFADVTDTILTSEALRKSEAEIKKVYTNIPVGIEIYDKNGVMVEVNDKELEIQSVKDKSVLLGLNLFEHPSLPKFAHDLLREGKDVTFDVNADQIQVNYEYYDVGGPRITKFLTIKCTILFNTKGEVENYLLIVIDNTEMYHTSARLREFEAAFNSVAEIAEIGLFKWNPLRKESFGTEQYRRNMGLAPDDENDFLIYREKVHPNDIGVLERFLEDAVAGKVNSVTHEFRVRDGEEWKWLRTACFITEYEPEKNNIQFLGVNYNINEMKVNEQKLFEAKSKAEEADRLKTAFLANMSHEIRTPLNAIVGFSGILVETENKEDKQQFIDIIKKNNDHLLNLISDILDISKIEAGTVDINMSYLMAEEICSQIIESLSIKNDMGLEMRFIPNTEQPNVLMETDSKRITQVLSNYLANALKFTRKGHIWLSYKVMGEEIEFSVEDTGIGIEEEHIDRLFERFFKVDDFVPGTGLGLSICRNIAERLGGQVGAESTLGVGTRFWFRVPMMFKYQ